MRALVLLTLLSLAFASLVITPDDAEAYIKFSEWKQKFHKVYSNDNEEALRFENFKASMVRVADRQTRAVRTKWGLTKFADLSVEEFRAKYLNFRPPQTPPSLPLSPSLSSLSTLKKKIKTNSPPKSFNWYEEGKVTGVLDQGQCGSCWAFSVVENIESMWAIAGHSLVELSEKQVIDCDKVDEGCEGGFPDTAYQYIINATGIETEKAYPYDPWTGKCKFDKTKVAARISGFNYAIPPCTDSCRHQDEEKLRTQLVDIGPFSICVNADPWQDYHGGDCCDDLCPSSYKDMNHCVQLIGYEQWPGRWVARNSWGGWGEGGWIYLYAKRNQCGLANWVTYANIANSTQSP
eukprot:TRINITY_DN306_c0_g1_i1.p1 TRINITY_DN306_c0_g1~~TRINITY_DN306_c0_g1_i1.p1  ORF type:complete len:349 (-),score=80.34 TRINITY_DN306_c0_g1_i1:318-1364(-)